jgi:hypothetical protein
MVSMYRFAEGWFFEPGAVTLEEHVRTALGVKDPAAGYWSHLLSWWAEKDNPNVLLLSYEDMTARPEANVRRLAGFCGIPLDDALLALALERSSLAFMLSHKDRFDDAMMRRLSEERCGLPPGSDSAKVRLGKVGSHREELTDELAGLIDARWTEVITPRLGFPDYAALEAALVSGLVW